MTGRTADDEQPLATRIAERPKPAAVWVLAGILLLLPELGAVLELLFGVESVPTLLSREVIPNQGYYDGERWVGTFLGLEPAHAWLVRVALIYAYAFAWLGWLWNGYLRFRTYYRYADWTPRDDMVDRLRRHRWGQFGFVVVVMFVVLALFAPALAPTPVEQNIYEPYSYEITYWDDDANEVRTATVGQANLQSKSTGNPATNVGPLSYDEFGRFHPFGTIPNGKDLFTFMASGARVSLLIGVASMAAAGMIALVFSMVAAYYKGLADLVIVLTSDSVQALPVLMVLILVSVVFQGTWVAGVYDGALLLIGIFILVQWPYLWRAIRGPASQVAQEEWVDAAKSFGQTPRITMQKHMVPYVIGYLLVYASLSLGGIIISVAGLSFLGLGINPPTPEWGRVVGEGQPYVATVSWHISLIPGFLITLVVTAFNALGDGIRDAIDPESEGAEEGGSEVAAAGGSGA